ncbi:MAG: hypothetical protein V4660_02005 [Pseudomonadota bacterium]
MKNQLIFFLYALLAGISFHSSMGYASDSKITNKFFYRYTNEQGTKVVGQTIPPQYVRAGYEVVTVNGAVIKVVPASPSEADAERFAKERKAAKERALADVQLRRSYSGVGDIEAAKIRNLQELRNNIDILQANLFGVKSQLKNQEAQAAMQERNGQKISEDLLNNIATLHSEEKEVASQIQQREFEFKTADNKFEEDKKRFIEITKPKAP